jgi:hypothetical protein
LRRNFALAKPALPAHIIGMDDVKHKVAFEPVKTGTGWCVRVVLPNGKELNLGGFTTEPEAKEWIARKSLAWLKLKGCETLRAALSH